MVAKKGGAKAGAAKKMISVAKKPVTKARAKVPGAMVAKGPGRSPVVLLAHSAAHAPQGCNHPQMKAWAKALAAAGFQVENTLTYPKPFNLMAKLCSAHVTALEKAARHGRPIVLVGLGMGARTAVHLLGQTPGDDGHPLPPLPPKLRAAVVRVVAINYPLLRVGTRELRERPLLALPAATPKMLFVTGPKDPHMDEKKLEGVRKKMKARTQVIGVASSESEKMEPADLVQIAAKIKVFATA